MAYTSRAWISGWSYDKAGTDFNATVGRILAHGMDYDTSMESIRATRKAARAAAAPTHLQHTSSSSSSPLQPTQTQQQAGTSPHPGPGPRPGYAWVDGKGQVLQAAAAEDPAAAFRGAPLPHPASHSPYATLSAVERSMVIWKRISPGMLPGSSATPPSATKSAFTWEPHLHEPLDQTHHLKKTDFAAYTECALRHMHHLKAAAAAKK